MGWGRLERRSDWSSSPVCSRLCIQIDSSELRVASLGVYMFKPYVFEYHKNKIKKNKKTDNVDS